MSLSHDEVFCEQVVQAAIRWVDNDPNCSFEAMLGYMTAIAIDLFYVSRKGEDA